MFDQQVIEEISSVARQLSLEPAALLAVAEVESGGRPFAQVAGRREPLIRFEGHYFDKRLSPAARRMARAAGLASPVAGRIANPSTQAARWQLVEQAAAIDRRAAHESVSWGIGQVMGSHWDWLGYGSVDALVAEARSGVGGQVRLMVRYIDKAGLIVALRSRDWHAFARGYNGPQYRSQGYHSRLSLAYRRHAAVREPGDANPKPSIDKIQERLVLHGQTVAVDGMNGPRTQAAILAFQSANGLAADGIVGPQTWAALERPPTPPA